MSSYFYSKMSKHLILISAFFTLTFVFFFVNNENSYTFAFSDESVANNSNDNSNSSSSSSIDKNLNSNESSLNSSNNNNSISTDTNTTQTTTNSESNSSSSSSSSLLLTTGIKNKTSGNSLDILVKLTDIPSTNKETKFKIFFYQPDTEQIQVHIDYDLLIFKDGSQIFSAAQQTGQPLLHTAEGMVTIPFSFPSVGEYNVKVNLYGINFIPLNPEEITFNISVNQ